MSHAGHTRFAFHRDTKTLNITVTPPEVGRNVYQCKFIRTLSNITSNWTIETHPYVVIYTRENDRNQLVVKVIAKNITLVRVYAPGGKRLDPIEHNDERHTDQHLHISVYDISQFPSSVTLNLTYHCNNHHYNNFVYVRVAKQTHSLIIFIIALMVTVLVILYFGKKCCSYCGPTIPYTKIKEQYL